MSQEEWERVSEQLEGVRLDFVNAARRELVGRNSRLRRVGGRPHASDPIWQRAYLHRQLREEPPEGASVSTSVANATLARRGQGPDLSGIDDLQGRRTGIEDHD
jgi:hypothetical protein